ncbi:MAG: hypothetical protein QOF83_2349, partial [Solirubrobacteraceae bacterium]|nr:hypothetical protein [Solirubrobacteraceae bacterium]
MTLVLNFGLSSGPRCAGSVAARWLAQRCLWLSLVLVGLGLASAAALPATAAAATGQTIVSLTFDDGTASQYWALAQLQAHNMTGTFYINSARTGTSDYYMNWTQIHDLYKAGNEIGGHTADHVDLPNTDPAEAQRQVCDDRSNLLSQGYAPTDFAYPYGDYNSSIEQMVASCGYNSARTSVLAPETNPPADPYAIRSGASSSTLAAYESAVTNAEQRGGGWVPVTFHQICNACDTDWITQADFSSFLTWLQGQQGNGVVVSRVADVIGGSVKPAVTVPFPPAPNGQNVLRNASLEYNTSNGGSPGSAPDCYTADQTGNNSATWSWTNDAHTGSWAERVVMSNYTDGDAKLYQNQDLGQCTPSVTSGHTYVVTEWYKSTIPVYFTAFSRDSLGAFGYWDSSPTFAASSTWKKATWTTQVVPKAVTGLSVGLTISGNGTLTVDDFGIQDAKPTGSADTSPPTVSLTSPSSGASVAGTVAITANASDNVAVDHVDYLVDGAVAGTTTNGLNTYNWYTRNLSNGAHTIAVRAVDPAGNATTTSAISVNVANSPTNLLQNASLETTSGGSPSCWLLGGYGTNSFTWAPSTDAHTGANAENLNVSAWTNGDRKLVSAQDTGTCAPAATPGHTYTVTSWYKVPAGSTASPRFFAYYRNSAGAWTFWTQSPLYASSSTWTQQTWSTPALPTGATNLSVGMGLQNVGSVTMDDFGLFDNSPPADTTAPTSSITCNGSSDGG